MLLDLQESEVELGQESDEKILALSIYRPSMFAIILERYQDAFERKAEQIVGTKEDAEDVVQDTFTKIYRYAKNFEVQEGATFKSWAYKILMNTSFTHYQKLKKNRHMTVPLSEELEAIIPDAQSRQFEKFETADMVVSVFQKMSGPFRNVLHSYFIEGKSQAEIADEEGVSVGAIKTRVHRAKEEFKKVNMGVL